MSKDFLQNLFLSSVIFVCFGCATPPQIVDKTQGRDTAKISSNSNTPETNVLTEKDTIADKSHVEAETTIAKNPYLRSGPAIKEKVLVKRNSDSSNFRPINSWVGERFIFLPEPKSFKKYPYSGLWSSKLPYEKYVGRIAEVVSVEKEERPISNDKEKWTIVFKMEDNGQNLTIRNVSKYIRSLAPLSDIDAVRSMWLGKKLFIKGRYITKDDGKHEYLSLEVEENSPLKVIDVVAGFEYYHPVRLFLETISGEVGYVDVNWSGTNTDDYFRKRSRFAHYFYVREPLTSNPYLSKGKTLEQKPVLTKRNKPPFAFTPIDSWVGERFVFLPKPKLLQEYGYQNFEIEDFKYPPKAGYHEYVGRIARVVLTTKKNEKWKIIFEMEDNGQRLKAVTSVGGYIDGIAPIADIDDARIKWLGKTLWLKEEGLQTYDEELDKYEFVNVKKNSAVKVVGIVAGFSYYSPVRFIVHTKNKGEGFVDVSLSKTNSSDLREYHKFEACFSTINRKKRKTAQSRTSKTAQSRTSSIPLDSCFDFGYAYGRCAARSMIGLKCEPGTDIVIPQRCRNKSSTQNGINEGVQSVTK